MNLRKLAKGRECMIRIPGVCNGNRETTVLAHLNNKRVFGVGIGQKVPDIFGSHCCSDCHDVLDGRVSTGWTETQLLVWFYEGVFRTQNQLLKEGLIKGA